MEKPEDWEPLGREASAAFIFSRRQARQRQPVEFRSGGKGMWGSSAHQQLPSGWQSNGVPHLAQSFCTRKV
jgi:hypothetical protein